MVDVLSDLLNHYVIVKYWKPCLTDVTHTKGNVMQRDGGDPVCCFRTARQAFKASQFSPPDFYSTGR
jgi:hypothetical protein